MIPRNIDNFSITGPSWWEELGHGAPTIASFAQLCMQGLQLKTKPATLDELELSGEAKAILWLSRNRGLFEIRAHKDGFDSAERLLAVAVETEKDVWRILLEKDSPRQTVRFLEAFGTLCRHGLILHHLQREFSLSAYGFELSEKIEEVNVANLIEAGFVVDT